MLWLHITCAMLSKNNSIIIIKLIDVTIFDDNERAKYLSVMLVNTILLQRFMAGFSAHIDMYRKYAILPSVDKDIRA